MMGTVHSSAGDGPGAVGFRVGMDRQLHRLHHLAYGAVRQDHAGYAVLVRKVESFGGEFRHFLNAGRSQDDHVEVAVAWSAGGLKVVRLRGLDTAQSRAAPLHVHHQRGQIRSRQIG